MGTIDVMRKGDTLVPVDLCEMRKEAVYLAEYPRYPRLISGYFTFRVKIIKRHCVHVLFEYAVRKVGGHEQIKGDEPSILAQSDKTKLWTHFGATARAVPIKVTRLEGARLAKFLQDQEHRKKVAPDSTKFPLNSYQIKEIDDLIERQARAEVQE